MPFEWTAFFGSPISWNTSQCSVALPSASILKMSTPANPAVLRVVVEQIDEMEVCPDIIVDGDDPVDHDPQMGAILGDLVEKPG